jgi:hypothetical protein
MYPQARSVGQWLRHGWHVVIAYVVGLFFILTLMGWESHERHKRSDAPAAVTASWTT